MPQFNKTYFYIDRVVAPSESLVIWLETVVPNMLYIMKKYSSGTETILCSASSPSSDDEKITL